MNLDTIAEFISEICNSKNDNYKHISQLDEHFNKVKPTVKELHDEVVRVFHIVSYELDAKEEFEYNEMQLKACRTFEGSEFKLPQTVMELSFWAKKLHNCMFGYSKKIHQNQCIIYGVFKEEELLYAVELNGIKIVQAKAHSNRRVPEQDMKTIEGWWQNDLQL